LHFAVFLGWGDLLKYFNFQVLDFVDGLLTQLIGFHVVVDFPHYPIAVFLLLESNQVKDGLYLLLHCFFVLGKSSLLRVFIGFLCFIFLHFSLSQLDVSQQKVCQLVILRNVEEPIAVRKGKDAYHQQDNGRENKFDKEGHPVKNVDLVCVLSEILLRVVSLDRHGCDLTTCLRPSNEVKDFSDWDSATAPEGFQCI
jgi:hypothetical protein